LQNFRIIEIKRTPTKFQKCKKRVKLKRMWNKNAVETLSSDAGRQKAKDMMPSKLSGSKLSDRSHTVNQL
jgi:hypothetical protein